MLINLSNLEDIEYFDKEDFIIWLLDSIKSSLYNAYLSNINKFEKLDLYLKNNRDKYLNKMFLKTNKILTSRDIVYSMINNLEYVNLGDKFIIDVNPNCYIRDCCIKTIDAAKLLNYGNFSFKGVAILDETLNFYKKNLQLYLYMYMEGA